MDRTIRLRTGRDLPRIGLGVYQAARGEETRRAVVDALALGYRHIDTARIYGNEKDVGAALRDSGVPREEVFITTKLWNDDHGHDRARRALDASLGRLGLEYVDLYLVHWPVPKLRRESWRALEEAHAAGQARAIGVSNYMSHHLDELLAAAKVPPAVNQIELSPFLQQRELVHRCRELGIVVEAYSPLTRGQRLEDRRLRIVADAVQRSPAQVLVRWAV